MVLALLCVGWSKNFELGFRMKTRLTKSVILSTSLLLALTALSSCGKDKEVKSNPPTAQTVPAPEKQPGEVAPANPDNSLPAPGQTDSPDNSLPQTSTPDSNQSEVLPDLPPAQGGPVRDDRERAGRDNRGQQSPGQNQGQVQFPSDNVQQVKPVAKHDPVRAYQVDFSKDAVKTGGQAEELFYTSAGDDGVMEEFKLYNSKVSAEQQKMNNYLAKAILNAKLARVTAAGQTSLTLTVDEFGTMKTYKLLANSDGEKLNLALSKAGTTGEMEFQGGFVKCIDKSGGCDVAYAKLKFAGGYTRIIFRNAAADLHFLIQQDVSNNSAFSTMATYIGNATNNLNVAKKIEGMKLSSFEVINGRAGLGAMMTTLDRQVVGFNVPMVSGSVGSEVSATVMKNADLSKNFDLTNLTSSYSVELSRSINQVRLVKNDGRGHFKLQMIFGNEGASASIWVVAASMQKEVISIEQIRAFESKLKVF